MKLTTTIQPRADGTVMVHGDNGQNYAFVANEEGHLECEVEDEAVIAKLVSGGHFFPSDPADFDAADALTKPKANDAEGEGEGEGEAGFGNTDAMPIEAKTPAGRFKAPKKK
jgi:hypothetical protein